MQILLTTKRHFTVALWMLVRLARNYTGVFERTRRSMRCVEGTFNLMEDILSAYYKCTLSPITHKINVSGQIFIWALFHVIVRGTRIQNLSAPFSYTLYKYKVP
jgi:hypothetical protein